MLPSIDFIGLEHTIDKSMNISLHYVIFYVRYYRMYIMDVTLEDKVICITRPRHKPSSDR